MELLTLCVLSLSLREKMPNAAKVTTEAKHRPVYAKHSSSGLYDMMGDTTVPYCTPPSAK